MTSSFTKFEGTIIKKFQKRVVIQFERTIYVKKYERYSEDNPGRKQLKTYYYKFIKPKIKAMMVFLFSKAG